MKKIIKRFIITLGFFTTIPVKYIEWEEDDTKYLPLFMPIIGLVISFGLFMVYNLILYFNPSSTIIAIFYIVYFIIITGGLHLDAFMDTMDAHFSRRDIDKKLLIMKDSNVGAFAVVYLAVLFMVKFALINEISINNNLGYIILLIPIVSRIMQVFLLTNTRYAKEDSLAKMYQSLDRKYQYLFYFYVLIVVAIYYLLFNSFDSLLLFVFAYLYMKLYQHFAIKQFNGITGDVIGCYVEIVEVLLLGLVIFL